MAHANHQGEPGDTGTGWVLVPREPTEEMIFAASGIRPGDLGYPAKSHMLRFDYRAMIASAPTPPDRVGEEVGRLHELTEDEIRRRAATLVRESGWKPGDRLHGTAVLQLMTKLGVDLALRPATDRCACPECGCDADAVCRDASAPSPDPAGGGGDLEELERLSKAAAKLIAKWDGAPELPEEMEQALSQFEDAWAWADEFLSNRSGKLVASTGSGEETKGAEVRNG